MNTNKHFFQSNLLNEGNINEKPLLVSSGEPAGIGPDLCVALAEHNFPVVILGDEQVLTERANDLGKKVEWVSYKPGQPIHCEPGYLSFYPIPCAAKVIPGELNPKNAAYVLKLLCLGADLCDRKEFSALITAPVHKGNINTAGIPFTGHTEFFAQYFQSDKVVMMLACDEMRVALVTTHLPLSQVPKVITDSLIIKVVLQVHDSLKHQFGIPNPKIKIAGLNPHAGESGYLGREELDVIIPALEVLQKKGVAVQGPLPADTLFIKEHIQSCDAFVVMYHDQGLPVLKYAGFDRAVNITLGLPIIRTSVDHGTALHLAGKNMADTGSFFAAVSTARQMAFARRN